MKNKITTIGIDKNFIFITQNYQFYPILMASDLFVRPTNTDGDAISIREALHFRIPSVVSDAVPRPKGTNLFKNRDIHSFTIKVENILENYETNKRELEKLELENNFDKIISVYQKFKKL